MPCWPRLRCSLPALPTQRVPRTVTYVNDSDASVRVGYDVGVFSHAGELEMALPPVDEPAGAGLLFAGLSLVWLVRRRR